MSEKKQETGKLSTPKDTGLGGGMSEELEKKLEQLSAQETQKLVKSFQDHFDKCTKACRKPNILVAGITGTGKSSLINAVFGEELAKSGAGMPVTQHFQKFEPKDKPIVVYDSKGLEWKEHRQFIKDTGDFFESLRKKPDVADHIHVVWYVVNTGRGRFEDFEAELVRKVFNPTPVIFILNKGDLADSKQIKAVKKVIEDEKLPNNKGIHICIANRENWTQQWCPDCLSDDVFYDEETKELECSDCGYTCIQKKNFGMKKLIQHTCDLLPELAKDAFMYSQTASIAEKDNRARTIVLGSCKGVTLDTSGGFIQKVAEMCAKLFVVWGWPLTAGTFREGLASLQTEYITKLKFQERLAAAAVDKLFGSRLSKAFAGFIGFTMNRGMKKLNESLIKSCAKGELDNLKIDDFFEEADLDEDIVRMFFEIALREGIENALDKMWNLSAAELKELMKQMDFTDATAMMFGDLKIDDSKLKEVEELLAKTEEEIEGDITIKEITDKDEEMKEEEETKEKIEEKLPTDKDLD